MSLAVEFIREPRPVIMRRQYKFMIHTNNLTELEIFTEAYLRGLVSGVKEETVANDQKEVINAQLQCDYERWVQKGQDLTPVIMHHRASVDEITITINDVFEEVERLEASNANPRLVGVQLDFAICCLKRTIISDSEEWNKIQEMVDSINSKYAEICNKLENTPSTSQNARSNNTFNSNMNSTMYQTPLSGYYTAPSTGSRVYYVPQYHPQLSPCFVPQAYQAPLQHPMNATFSNFNNTRQMPVNPRSNPATATSSFNRNNTPQRLFQNNSSEYAVIGPHKVSATIINIIGKNVYEAKMDALDQIETWECQANTLHVPIEYFLSYMEILLAKELQGWWQLHRPKITSWTQFRVQFLEDFGDHNRVIKAEQSIANLTQKADESFQQLFLRFTKLMSRVKPEKSEADMLYILRSSLKPELRAACMSVTSIADLKRL
ncbi:hypothetical protein ACKWTF_004001 [Chironomus riparius]